VIWKTMMKEENCSVFECLIEAESDWKQYPKETGGLWPPWLIDEEFEKENPNGRVVPSSQNSTSANV
jgi:hypothetical protein